MKFIDLLKITIIDVVMYAISIFSLLYFGIIYDSANETFLINRWGLAISGVAVIIMFKVREVYVIKLIAKVNKDEEI